MGKTELAPGFRFHPTDVELVRYYLKRKVMGKKLLVDAIAEVDIYKFEPPDLPDMSYIKGGDLKWHFFCPREKKYAKGVRANRATECGYWKTTGKERAVMCDSEVVGMIRTLVYHFGKSPRGERTDWVMHEYRLEDKVLREMNVPQDTYVVCVIFKKDGLGPRNGAQYGAPFREEDWSDKEEERTVVAVTNNPANLLGPNKETSTVATDLHDCISGMVSESCVSDVLPATTTTTTTSELPHPSDAPITPMSTAPVTDPSSTPFLAETLGNNYDDIYSMLDRFTDDDPWLPFSGLNNSEVRLDSGVSAQASLEEEGIFNQLPDLSNMHNNNMPRTPSFDLLENSELYLELQDLTTPLTPQTGSLNTSLNHQGHLGFSSANDDHPYGFSSANDDPCGFSPSMGHGPNM